MLRVQLQHCLITSEEKNRLPLWNVYNVEIRTNIHLEGWLLKMNLKAAVQLRITALTAEYDGGTRTMEQFLKVVAYYVPEPINF
ncbi:hypothetical protein T4E_9105 [Trichinella pseudospiralis]|uniref:Uncharacterized protein n=1 Tax=Trichinella pseudospiralis TaxID=6337 RepID=A0A0V0YFJ4_TRIPS|nr:hypothetical protein T4E_9105 [Trichinella pseudospiralis]